MKINTKSCFPPASAAAAGLDNDVMLINPNKFINDESKHGDDDDDDDGDKQELLLGRQVQLKPMMILSPVMKSTRKSTPSNGSAISYQKKDAVTPAEMKNLSSCLQNLFIDQQEDETKSDDISDDDQTEISSSKMTKKKNSDRYSIGADGKLYGRIPQYVFDSNGEASTVLKSARKSKKKVHVDI
jgi:hypothetical protein